MKIKTQTLIQRSLKGNTYHFGYFKGINFLDKEGEHISYNFDETLPQSLIDEINKNGCNVINFNLLALKPPSLRKKLNHR
jgi:hypothetical protein